MLVNCLSSAQDVPGKKSSSTIRLGSGFLGSGTSQAQGGAPRARPPHRNRSSERGMCETLLSLRRTTELVLRISSEHCRTADKDPGVSFLNLMLGILFGRRLTSEEYVNLGEVIRQRFELAVGKPRDFMPWLAWLPDRKGIQAQWELRRAISRSIDPLIEERKQVQKSGRTDHQATFVDTLLGLRGGKVKTPFEITDADVESLSIELLTTGTDTTALNLEYCIANLINNPEIQEKLALEISSFVGERVVNEADIPHLPYLQAVIKENFRRHSPGRLAPPRRALSATKVAGYDIPVNTFVQQHLEAVSLNPEIWENPLEFRPERHLNRPLDITGSTEITMIPFGVGRRMCPAINVAFLHAELILARLVQAFEWKSVTPGQLLDVSPGGIFSNPMKYPLVASIQERRRSLEFRQSVQLTLDIPYRIATFS